MLHLGDWPGITAPAPTAWTTALRTGDGTARRSGLSDLAAGSWELEPWAWRDTVLRSRFETGEWLSLHYLQDPAAGEPLRRYVNFERPAVRTRIGIDTLDLLVDLVVEADLSAVRWKDADEYEHGRRLGSISDADHRTVEQGARARPRPPAGPCGSVRRPLARPGAGRRVVGAGPARRG
ncbi:DUF402 domain-containing protein [Kitasatospora sp. NPDC059571]|uniref:DUF402 domain-containing protein n=1 Tax=Kitasatospora sp. NPDC059571 TaxID=3346871 RepID=UPI0036A9FC0C